MHLGLLPSWTRAPPCAGTHFLSLESVLSFLFTARGGLVPRKTHAHHQEDWVWCWAESPGSAVRPDLPPPTL